MRFGFAAPGDSKFRTKMRGTSGVPRHTKLTRYRCSLPGLAGFAGNRCTEPEVPPIGRKFSRTRESSTRFQVVKVFAWIGAKRRPFGNPRRRAIRKKLLGCVRLSRSRIVALHRIADRLRH